MTVLDAHPLAETPMPPVPLSCTTDLALPDTSDRAAEFMDVSIEADETDNTRPDKVRSRPKGSKDGSTSKKNAQAGSTPTRGRRKSRWKLKFHHQALPPEYLKHYKQQEKRRRLTETKKVVSLVDKSKAKKSIRTPCETGDMLPVEAILQSDERDEEAADSIFSNSDVLHPFGTESDDLKNDGTRIDDIWQPPNLLDSGFPPLNIDLSQNKAFLENLLSNQIEINRVDRPEKRSLPVKQPKPKKAKAIPPSGKIMNYADLPYMGEITLDGIKPRRGRKPKKADICHLIYKNYGQIFPGAPKNVAEEVNQKVPKWKQSAPRLPPQTTITHALKPPLFHPQSESPLPSVSGLINHTEVQNRIINSLLERRLTQEFRNKSEASGAGHRQEPLNLCMRDLKSLKIKLSRKHGNIYEAKSPETLPKAEVEVKKEVIDLESDEGSSVGDSDLTPFNLVTTEMRDSSDEDSCVSLGSQVTLSKIPEKTTGKTDQSMMLPPDNVMGWPGSSYFPMGNFSPMPLFPEMYYQKLNEMKAQQAENKTMRAPKTKLSTKRQSHKSNAVPSKTIAKRKRSAIFIPPVPAENTANPTTEVSICKFKFTGGAKPSLQEKKMLSVDSGGNFRYYSGTGDKSMRGYEYFPRESLQQCQENTGCSPSGVFLTASALGSGEKIPEDVGHSGFFDPTFPFQLNNTVPETRPKSKKVDPVQPGLPILRDHSTDSLTGDDEDEDSENSISTSPSPLPEGVNKEEISGGDETLSRRVRRSRKSLAREKLEQTFKEKGFLIQTQQLESAEGATYCKFRQLRKFTRYLFRSWKDYLPGNVRDLSMDAGVCLPTDPNAIKVEVPDS